MWKNVKKVIYQIDWFFWKNTEATTDRKGVMKEI